MGPWPWPRVRRTAPRSPSPRLVERSAVIGASVMSCSLEHRIVGVALGTHPVEGGGVRLVQRRVQTKSLRQVRVRDVGNTEGNHVGMAGGKSFGCLGLVKPRVEHDWHVD